MRKILRLREIRADDWRYLAEVAAATAAGEAVRSIIVSSAELKADASRWQSWEGRLGVKVGAAEKVEELAVELPRLSLVAFEFPNAGDGRGYTYARLLRARYGFGGEIRAVGQVKCDQIFFMARSGFDAFEVAPGEDIELARAALERYSVAYQPGAPGAPVPAQRFFAA
ncbi:MAG TPA: DUF934 domain-containing protein [Steroidobacteraceae bacterium]|nr:DUF934 domain-containing protein [Steroidobacteraceae bacterium]